MGWMTGATAALVLVSAGAGAQTNLPDGETFVRQVFASYADPDGNWPLNDHVLDDVWTPRMAALIRRDRELATEDLPYLDADPLCQCQDTEGLIVQSLHTIGTRGGILLMNVTFTNGGEAMQTHLVLDGAAGQGWRIGDVQGADGYSLAAELEQSNRLVEAGRPALGRD